MNNVELKRMTVTAIFIAIGVLLAPFVSFPFGGARVFPLQHLINVLLAVLVGWRYSTAGAFCISSIRMAMGVGTVLAYPGSMIGAALAGIFYKRTGSIWGAVAGEIIGTGLLGGLIAYPVAAFVLDSKAVALWFFIVAFYPIPASVPPAEPCYTAFCPSGNWPANWKNNNCNLFRAVY